MAKYDPNTPDGRYTLNNWAAMNLHPGDKTRCGWTLVRLVQCRGPWPWCLVRRRKEVARVSPRMFREAMPQ